MMLSTNTARRAAIGAACFVILTASSFARAQGTSVATNQTASKPEAEKQGDVPRPVVVSTPADQKQEKPAETVASSKLSDPLNPVISSRGSGNETAPPGPQSSSEEWQFQFTPYLFMSGIKGTAGARGFTSEVDAKFSDIIDEVNFGFMGTFEARKNKFMFLTDMLYINLSDSEATPGPLFSSVKADFKVFILDPEVGYRVAEKNGASLDLLGGLRYWHVNLRLDFREGVLPAVEAERSKNWVDAVGGLRVRAPLSERWFVVGKVDLGGGGSDFTYQFVGAVGVDVAKSVSLLFGYRYLSVDYDKDDFLFDMSLKGPIIGARFRF
ncbi:MAG TPA: hypothetical protein VLD57_13145 [Blastocatellia bacterium]|nr:hypothetical protein [Blastocatellia bacterium]